MASVSFSVRLSLSFLEGFSYTKNNGYLGVITGVSRAFHPRMKLKSYLTASWAVLTLLTKENGGPMWTAARQTSRALAANITLTAL